MSMIALLKEILEKIENVKFAYLFGSYADETFTDRSDVDIALFLDDVTFDNQLIVHDALSRELNKDIDLVILNRTKNLYLLEDIITKGILIKDGDGRIDFELKKHHQYIDYIEFKKRINAA